MYPSPNCSLFYLFALIYQVLHASCPLLALACITVGHCCFCFCIYQVSSYYLTANFHPCPLSPSLPLLRGPERPRPKALCAPSRGATRAEFDERSVLADHIYCLIPFANISCGAPQKCDEQPDDAGQCQTCVRLRLECLGFGAKRPEWLRVSRATLIYIFDPPSQ